MKTDGIAWVNAHLPCPPTPPLHPFIWCSLEKINEDTGNYVRYCLFTFHLRLCFLMFYSWTLGTPRLDELVDSCTMS